MLGRPAGGIKSVTHWGTRLLAVSIVVVGACAGLVPAALAQPTSKEQACIAAFNKGVRKVAKTQGGIINKCLKNYAAGKLTGMGPEACVLQDPADKRAKAINKAAGKAMQVCQSVTPPFGVTTPIETAMVNTALRQIELVHSAFGSDLDSALLTNGTDATCQARIGTALMKCEDRRIREFVKCKKTAMKRGVAVDAASLESACLGSLGDPQPDPAQRIGVDCGVKIAQSLGLNCTSSPLANAFAACNGTTQNEVTDCLRRESACHLCLLINEVDGLSRDCDLMDDGNASNGSCGNECGDGVVQSGEQCDDGDTDDNDGCAVNCSIEGGWFCTGEPSVCTLLCGNGSLDPGETCDDGDQTSGDGCSNACTVENGYSCTGEPSVCVPDCGNGTLQAGEACDDGDTSSGDGCSNACQVEPGYNCSGTPSVCTFVCGNGTFQSGETCDDGDAMSGDGCSGVCQIEPGWMCSGAPSLCTPTCGDGLVRGSEGCDDGDTFSGDGCSFSCQVEPGFSCSGQPSNCIAVCGDGFIRGFENCDDSNTMSGDGCSGNFCRQEAAYACAGQPSNCIANCGDGNLDVPEGCDDGNTMPGDGCSSTCAPESGYACGGQPSVCAPTCGNGLLNLPNEACDDGDLENGDGCTSSCRNEPGWFCLVPGMQCEKFDVFIDTPANGVFTTAGSVVITGHYTTLPLGTVSISVNGVTLGPLEVNEVTKTFSHTVTLNSVAIFNPVLVVLTNTLNGDDVRDRIVVINGLSVPDGSFANQSVALRLNDTGLDAVEPLVGDLAAGSFNLGTLLPPGTVLADECFITVIGCWGSAQVRIANPPPSFSHLTLAVDSKPNVVTGDIHIFDIRVDVFIDGSGLVPDCGLRLTANSLQVLGDYELSPKPGDPSNVDVNLTSGNPSGTPDINFAGFNHTFTSGICDDPIIGDIIQSFLPNIETTTRDAIRGFLKDPDQGGPADSPVADAIEQVLEGISIAGPIGAGLGLTLESPLFTVAEDNVGITFGSNTRFSVVVGNDPGECQPPPGAPNLIASYAKSDPFPSFGANTPVGNVPYGLGICISTTGFNQLLRGQTECGLMRTSLTTIDLDGPGGNPALAIDSTLLSLIVPEFSQLPAHTPLRIDVAPTLAPIITGNNGPAGELTELKIAQVEMQVVEPGPETVWLSGALDTRLGLDLDFNGSGLGITLSPPTPGNLTIAVIENPLGANETQVEAVLPALLTPLIPQLAGAISGFPLPQFFGLNLQGLETSRNGQFLSLWANLVPAP